MIAGDNLPSPVGIELTELFNNSCKADGIRILREFCSEKQLAVTSMACNNYFICQLQIRFLNGIADDFA